VPETRLPDPRLGNGSGDAEVSVSVPTRTSVIESFNLTRFQFPRRRVIGDSQVRIDMHHIGTLELHSSSGHTGLGFFESSLFQLPPLPELQRVFGTEVAPSLIGLPAAALLNRVSRPRGGNIRVQPFAEAIDQALWDVHAKELGLPLFRLLGGTSGRVPAYASGLDFHLGIDVMQAFFAEAAGRGFSAFKIKVGHPDLAWDLGRLRAVVDVVGSSARLMVDANEAWSPKEAIRRAHRFRDAGFDIDWVEDPCLRDDFDGLREVRLALPFTRVNAGEYLDLKGKAQLLAADAVDVLNVHGHISEALAAARLSASHGIPLALGNTPLELGVHLAAALPEVECMEYAFQDYDVLVDEPIRFRDGYAEAPDRPGHGLVLSEAARSELARPDAE